MTSPDDERSALVTPHRTRGEMDGEMFSPSAARARQSGRTERRFWSWTEEYKVLEVSGFDCLPDNPTTWWVPELGYSMTEGHHLFETRQEAARAAFAKISKEIARLEEYRENIDR